MRRIAQAYVDESVFSRRNTQAPGFQWLLIVAASLFFGMAVLWSRESWLLFYFVPAAYGAIFYSSFKVLQVWRDPLNPLCLVLAVAVVRFFLPGILVLSGVEASDENGLFRLMKLAESDWQWGHALALVGMLAVVFGWLLIQVAWKPTRPIKFHLTGAVKYAALTGMLTGFTALLLFFVMNAPLSAILTGTFRSTVIQEGTGPFFFLAYMLIAGSVLFCCYLLNRGFTWLALVPVGVSMILYWPLGGRGRALMSMAGGLILLWYRARETQNWRKLSVRPIHLITVPIIVFCLVSVFYTGAYYRGHSNRSAASEGLSFSGLGQYVEHGIYTDIGQLHSLAGAIAIGPAVLEGRSFIGSLSWPLNKFLPIRGGNAGIYLVDTLVGFVDDRKWAVNSSLIGDGYLNFGLSGTVAVMLIYGALLKVLYVKFRQGAIHGVIYTLATLYAVDMLWVSIEVWPQALTVLSFAFALIWLGEAVFNVNKATLIYSGLSQNRG